MNRIKSCRSEWGRLFMAFTYNGLPIPTESLEEIRMIDRMARISKQNNPDNPVIRSENAFTIKIYKEPLR